MHCRGITARESGNRPPLGSCRRDSWAPVAEQSQSPRTTTVANVLTVRNVLMVATVLMVPNVPVVATVLMVATVRLVH